ncbi:Winged helix-turn helix domain-containing protein [Shewanella pealeana]
MRLVAIALFLREITKYLSSTLKGLDAKKNRGRDSYLSSIQKQRLSAYIEELCKSSSGGRLTGDAILKYIQQQFNVDYHPNAIYKLLEQLGFSWVTSRRNTPNNLLESKRLLKKFQLETILNTPSSVALERVGRFIKNHGFKMRLALVSRTQQHVYGLEKAHVQERYANNSLNMHISSVQSVRKPEELKR